VWGGGGGRGGRGRGFVGSEAVVDDLSSWR
jgi:hypothetical protein